MSEIGNIGTWHMLVHRKPRLVSLLQRPAKGFWGTGEQRHFLGEQGNKGLKIKGTQAILGNSEHTKSRL